MDQETQQLHTRAHRRTASATTTRSSFRRPVEGREAEGVHEKEREASSDPLAILSKPAGFFVKIVASQLEFFSNSILSLLSPVFSFVSEPKTTPSGSAHDGSAILRRLSLGLFGAGYAAAVLLAVFVLSFLLGVGIVRMWVEEPVFLRRAVHFDYTRPEPTATVRFGGVGVRGRVVPAGHTATVCLELLMPESDYNRHIGMFQVTAEVISANEDVIVSSSRPCMLRFRSLPVRMMRTFIMGVPLLVGVSSESQNVEMKILRYKESNQKATGGIRVRLQPRAGTSHLPQLYAAELIINSKLPRRKELVYNWKWTFYVWISLYVYIMLLILLVCCFKPLVFPRPRGSEVKEPAEAELKVEPRRYSSRDDGDLPDDFSDALRRWRERSKNKRKVSFPRTRISEISEGSASCVIGGDTIEVIDDSIDDSGDFAASESSECVGV